jgi:hypothetical protein
MWSAFAGNAWLLAMSGTTGAALAAAKGERCTNSRCMYLTPGHIPASRFRLPSHSLKEETMARRCCINLILEVDMDMVPGFGYTCASWLGYIRATLNHTMKHYNPRIVSLSVEEK